MQNGLRFQPRQSGSWACSPPQTHPCSHWALRKCAARTWPPLPAVLPGPAPSGPGPGSQALGDFLTLSSWNHYQCVGAGERSCPLQAWRGSGRLAEQGGIPRETSQQRGSPGLALGGHWPRGSWWGWEGEGLGNLGQGSGDSGTQEVGTEEAEEMPGVGGRGKNTSQGLMGCMGAQRALWRKWGRLDWWEGVRLGSRVSEEAGVPCPALGFWSRERSLDGISGPPRWPAGCPRKHLAPWSWGPLGSPGTAGPPRPPLAAPGDREEPGGSCPAPVSMTTPGKQTRRLSTLPRAGNGTRPPRPDPASGRH